MKPPPQNTPDEPPRFRADGAERRSAPGRIVEGGLRGFRDGADGAVHRAVADELEPAGAAVGERLFQRSPRLGEGGEPGNGLGPGGGQQPRGEQGKTPSSSNRSWSGLCARCRSGPS